MISGKQAVFRQSKRHLVSAVAIFVLGFVNPVAAHVAYTDLSNPAVSPGGVNGGSFSNYGWYDGTTSTLGDSHELAGGTFFRFHLDAASNVSITFSDAFNSGNLNPAFSLYQGILPDEAHDDAGADPLNPAHLAAGHVVKDASPVDNGVTADVFGRISPFRDTANITFSGQFDALHSWSMANASGDWAVIEYIAHAGPTGGNSVSLLNQYLQAGDYTIAAAGGNVNNPLTNVTNIDGVIAFTSSPVPLPASVWLFASVIAGFGAFRKKRRE